MDFLGKLDASLILFFEVAARIRIRYGSVHMPRIHIRQSQVGPKLAITICLFCEIPLSNIFRKSQPSIMTPEPRLQANSYFI